MKWGNFLVVAGFFGLGALIIIADEVTNPHSTRGSGTHAAIAPDWAAIAAWPRAQVDAVDTQPDPNRRVTAIILDDSGSMGDDIEPAKEAVIEALAAMNGDDRVAVLALNHGIVQPFAPVSEARKTLPALLRAIPADGSTPLTRAVQSAEAALDAEAARARGFGTFRMIITTDGAANDGPALQAEIERIAATTPIQLTTIGIALGRAHVLRREDIGAFVDVANTQALIGALRAAVAENTDFTAITDFTEQEG